MSGGKRRGEVRIRKARPEPKRAGGTHNRKARRAAKARQSNASAHTNYPTDEQRAEDKSRMLALWLDLAVPLWVLKYRSEDWSAERRVAKAQRAGALIAEKADLLIRPATTKRHHEERADLLNAVAAGVAAMAFCPGGVTIFGRTFAVNGNDAAEHGEKEAREALDRAIATWTGEGGG